MKSVLLESRPKSLFWVLWGLNFLKVGLSHSPAGRAAAWTDIGPCFRPGRAPFVNPDPGLGLRQPLPLGLAPPAPAACHLDVLPVDKQPSHVPYVKVTAEPVLLCHWRLAWGPARNTQRRSWQAR